MVAVPEPLTQALFDVEAEIARLQETSASLEIRIGEAHRVYEKAHKQVQKEGFAILEMQKATDRMVHLRYIWYDGMLAAPEASKQKGEIQ